MEVCVSIVMITYNHEPFIAKAIEGVLMQKCNFPIKIIIGEDCSTDKTRQICKEYALKYSEITLLDSVKNIGMMPNFNRTLQSCTGKYIALCEGDDYWTDPLKLQKQIDFLEVNPEYSLTVGGFIKLEENTCITKEIIIKIQNTETVKVGYSFSLIDTEKSWITKTLTAVFRNDILSINELSKYKYGRDINLFYHLLKNEHRGFYFTEIMGVYRVHEGGVNSMKQGKINNNAAYNCYKELYLHNKDEFTRHKYLRHTLGLLNFNIYNSYKENSWYKNAELFFEACSITRLVEIRFLISALLPKSIKMKLRK